MLRTNFRFLQTKDMKWATEPSNILFCNIVIELPASKCGRVEDPAILAVGQVSLLDLE